VGAYLRLNETVWSRLPPSLTLRPPLSGYGRWLHALAAHGDRRQYFGTFFLRNRPELELMRRVVEGMAGPQRVRMAVLGCSIGTEVYSIAWTIRGARPRTRLRMRAVDIAPEAVAAGRAGVYSRAVDALAAEPVCALMTEGEIEAMFEAEGERLRVKPWLRDGITWETGDAGDPGLAERLGAQDVVVANRFLCHMPPADAERCLRNLSRHVAPGGFLFVSGVDLDVRARVARDLGWRPIPDLMAEIHDGDRTLRRSWPFRYWGLEPLDPLRPDARSRYASVFQIGEPAGAPYVSRG
jgi:SAM-dependent methyltransferase